MQRCELVILPAIILGGDRHPAFTRSDRDDLADQLLAEAQQDYPNDPALAALSESKSN